MNPFLLSSIWSYRKELKLVILTFILILLLPIFAVMLLTNVGIDVVSDKLATVNSKNHKIQIHNPDGSVATEIDSETSYPVSGVVTLEFGEIDFPYQPLHTGIDIANPRGKIGDPVHPFMDGTVTYAGEIFWGYGKHIIIDHGNHITSLYAHLDKIFVYPGEEVKINQVIGNEGTTGWSTGAHLHFETRVFGIPVNPRTFIEGDP